MRRTPDYSLPGLPTPKLEVVYDHANVPA